MSKLTRLSARLVKVQARIAEIEAKYDGIIDLKGYASGNQAGPGATLQDFGVVSREYRQLLAMEESLEDRIDEIQNGENTGSMVAAFRRPS